MRGRIIMIGLVSDYFLGVLSVVYVVVVFLDVPLFVSRYSI